MDLNAIIDCGSDIYSTCIPELNLKFNYRLLTLKEYKVFRSLRDGQVLPPFSVYEKAFERCYMGEYSLLSSELPAGIFITLGELIMYLSGDCDSDTLIEDIANMRKLNPADTVHEYMRSVIATVFSYRIEEMDLWTRTEFIKNFTIAENILLKQNPEANKLDLSKITAAGEQQAKPAGPPVDISKENRAIRKAMGPLAIEEAQGKMNRKQLQRLSDVSRNN